MMKIRTYHAIPGVCTEACIVEVPNSVGSMCCGDGHATHISHNHNPPEHEWVPLEIPEDEPEPEVTFKRSDLVGRRPAKGKRRVPGVGGDTPGKDADGG